MVPCVASFTNEILESASLFNVVPRFVNDTIGCTSFTIFPTVTSLLNVNESALLIMALYVPSLVIVRLVAVPMSISCVSVLPVGVNFNVVVALAGGFFIVSLLLPSNETLALPTVK